MGIGDWMVVEPQIGGVLAPLPSNQLSPLTILWKPKYNVYMTMSMISSVRTHILDSTKLFMVLIDWIVVAKTLQSNGFFFDVILKDSLLQDSNST